MSHFAPAAHKTVTSAKSGPSLISWILASMAVRRSRRQLGALDAQMLKDIGIAENQAQSEAKRPIWDVPSHWID